MGQKQAIMKLRNEGTINLSLWTNVGHGEHIDLKFGNCWCAEQEASNRSAKENNRNIVRAVKKYQQRPH